MFEYIALRFDSTLHDFELMEKIMSSLLSHCCLSLFDFAEPCTSCMMASFCSTIYDPLTLFLISAMAFVEENELVCLLRSFLEQPDIFRVRVSHVSGSLMIGTRRLLTLCLFVGHYLCMLLLYCAV